MEIKGYSVVVVLRLLILSFYLFSTNSASGSFDDPIRNRFVNRITNSLSLAIGFVLKVAVTRTIENVAFSHDFRYLYLNQNYP